MRQVTEVYGKFLLEGVILSLLVLLLFVKLKDEKGNRGIFKIAGAGFRTESADDRTYSDFDIYAEESAKEKPRLFYNGEGGLKPGTYQITDIINAVDYRGNALPVTLLKASGPAGEELLRTEGTNGVVVFLSPGIYTVKASAVDREKRRTVCIVKIPVNG